MVTQSEGQSQQLAIRARSLNLVDRRTTVFDGIDIALPVGEMLVLTGVGGSGKTSLLLALAGRLKPSGGQLTVLGLDLPAKAGKVRRRVAFTGNATVAALDDNLTVRQHIAEAIVLNGPWWKTWTTKGEVSDVIDRANAIITQMRAGGASALSSLKPLDRDQFVAVVGPLPRLVLGVVLALIAQPDILVIDDVDGLRDLRDRKLAWTSLATLRTPKTQNLTIVATCQDAGELPAALMEVHGAASSAAAATATATGTFVRRVTLLPVGDAPRSLHGATSNGTLHVGTVPDTTSSSITPTTSAAIAAEAN